MAWFKLTAPNGDPVQVNGDQLVCVRVPLAGFLPGRAPRPSSNSQPVTPGNAGDARSNSGSDRRKDCA
jgi:hypothetical protein